MGPSNWTKRVIGEPGDHVKGIIEDGKPAVYINGNKLDEPYLNQYPLLMSAKQVSGGIAIETRSYDPSMPDWNQPFYRIDSAYVLPEQFKDNFEGVSVGKGGRLFKEPHTPDVYNNKVMDEFDWKLNDHQYWLMGDNRRGSSDSRYLGPIDQRLIHGKILFRIWSVDSNESWWIWDLIKHPVDFWKRLRWNRFFQWFK